MPNMDDMKGEIMLTILVFFPFAAGLLCYGAGELCLWKRRRKSAGRQGEYDGGGETLRDVLAIAAVIAEFLMAAGLGTALFLRSQIMLLSLYEEESSFVLEFSVPEVCGLGLHFTMDGFRAVYAGVAAFMWMMATMLCREYLSRHANRNRFYLFLLWTLGAVMGVFLSADLYTTFLFFEMMSLTSYVWVAQEENRPSLKAAATYLTVAVVGGMVMLMGIFLLYHRLGTLTVAELHAAAQNCPDKGLLYAAGGCLLFGFGAKAGAFPLHIWLPKAHPVAPAPASALLSGILTKTGIYGILILSCHLFLHDGAWGKLVLTTGVVTMLLGALLALISIDLKRTLACSSMSQIGFILVGVGMQGMLGEENALAVYGTALHMVNHSLIKLALFLAAGVIFMNAHALDLNRIKGFGRRKPLLAGIFLIGALAIGGIPGFGGYVSKTLLHESILEYGGGGMMTAVEWLFLFSGGLTVAYMTKLFVAVFVEKNEDGALQERYDGMKKYMNPLSGFALTGSAAALLLWGMAPHMFMERAAGFAADFFRLEEADVTVRYFGLSNLKGAIISIAIGTVIYLLFVRRKLSRSTESGGREYVNGLPAWLDLEELFYRPLLFTVLPAVLGVLCRILDSFTDGLAVLLRKTVYRDSPLPHERTEGNAFTESVGRLLNGIQKMRARMGRKTGIQKDYVHLAAVKNEEFKENNLLIRRSLSFGLLLVCVGLMLTLFYLTFVPAK